MNVVRLAGSFPSLKKISHGLAPSLYHLSKEQMKLGMNVNIICKKDSDCAYEEIEGIKIHRVRNPYNLFALHKLKKVDESEGVDVVHAHATSCVSYAVLKKWLRLKKSRVGYVVHVHGTTKGVLARSFALGLFREETLKQRIQKLISVFEQNVMWKKADAVIAVSRCIKDELVNLYGIQHERVRVVYNGVDVAAFQPQNTRITVLRELQLPEDTRLILYLGGFRPVKGPTYLIKALEKIHGIHKDVKVLFVGNPNHPLERHYAEPIMDLIKHLKAKDTIHIVENIPHAQLPKYYSAVDALVVPSVYEGLPKVVLEAMACGTPVIASAVGGLPEVIHNGESGILVRPGCPDELADAVVKIVSDNNLSRELSLKAERSVKERFTWTHAAKSIMSIYQEVLKA